MAKIPTVPVENHIITLSVVKIAIKISPCAVTNVRNSVKVPISTRREFYGNFSTLSVEIWFSTGSLGIFVTLVRLCFYYACGNIWHTEYGNNYHTIDFHTVLLSVLYNIVNFTTQCGENRDTDIANFATLIHTKKLIQCMAVFTILYGNYYPPHGEFELICIGKFFRRSWVNFTQQYGKNRQRYQQNKFTMLYANYCYIFIKNFLKKFSPCTYWLILYSELYLYHEKLAMPGVHQRRFISGVNVASYSSLLRISWHWYEPANTTQF